MALEEEINSMEKVIYTDSYPMSIGELSNLYKENELNLHPEFQRFFRWDIKQKSDLVESILLGIPIPPIFVSQSESGVWDVIDGLQRLSTIFEFMGLLKNQDGHKLPASKLIRTKFLPSLQDKIWSIRDDNGDKDGPDTFTEAQRRNFKRRKISVQIVGKASDPSAKYELFQRLNRGGSRLSDQEVRNCLLVMLNGAFFEMVKELSEYQNFVNCIPLSDNDLEQRNDMELVVRFIVARHSELDSVPTDYNIQDYLTERIAEIAQDSSFDMTAERNIFCATFDYLNSVLGEHAFNKYYPAKQRFEGAVLISAFEALTLGISNKIEVLRQTPLDEMRDKIKSVYSSEEYLQYTRRGTRAIVRFKGLSKFSREYFE